VREWLVQAVARAYKERSEEIEGYVLGRGLRSTLADDMQVGMSCLTATPAPDPVYRKRNGPHGERRQHWLTVPFWSPRGRLVGLEYRRWDGEKGVQEYRLPEASTVPVFMGLTPAAMQKIWDGGDVWLVEGVFDIALAHAVPERDTVLACGSARVSNNQINFLKRFLASYATVHVAFDEDPTGRAHVDGYTDEKTGRRVFGVIERLERVELSCRAVRYRGGKDPGEIWERGGRAALKHSFKL
jgi:DNA primase